MSVVRHTRSCPWTVRLIVSSLLLTSVPARTAAAQSLEGTWGVEVTPYDCTTGARRAPFWTLQSFAAGGAMTVVTTNQALPAPPTPGLGRWSADGNGRFTSLYAIFLLFGPTVQPWGQRISQVVSLAGDQLTGEARGEAFVAPGTLPPPSLPLPPNGCASLSGRRFP